MCLIGFRFDPAGRQPLLLAANRDEYLERPTQIAGWWADAGHIYGGRDLQAGGTWMAVSRPPFDADGKRNCRFAALTNFRDGQSAQPGQRSRGELVSQLLSNRQPVLASMRGMSERGDEYAGFNLLGFQWQESETANMVSQCSGWHLSNRGAQAGLVVEIPPGVHGVSNGQFNEPWPKTKVLINTLAGLDPHASFESTRSRLLQCLSSQAPMRDEEIPDTGLPTHAEQDLARLFIRTALGAEDGRYSYGTRSSAVVSLRQDRRLSFEQWTWQTESPGPDLDAYRRMVSPVS